MNEQEFQDRIVAVSRARKIFIKSGITNNISVAFELYQGVLAEQARELELRASEHGNRARSELDKYPRPICPLCGAGIMFKPMASKGDDWVKTHLLCENPRCDGYWLSAGSFHDWLAVLKAGKGPEVDLSKILQSSKKAQRKNRAKYKELPDLCPNCGKTSLYELEKCCGAPEGVIECSECDYTETPSVFHGRRQDNGL